MECVPTCLGVSRSFLEVSRSLLEVSRSLLEVSRSLLMVSRSLLEVSRSVQDVFRTALTTSGGILDRCSPAKPFLHAKILIPERFSGNVVSACHGRADLLLGRAIFLSTGPHFPAANPLKMATCPGRSVLRAGSASLRLGNTFQPEWGVVASSMRVTWQKLKKSEVVPREIGPSRTP